MIKVVVIADDLTGALDTGIQFAKNNLSTLVITELNFEKTFFPKDIEAIVIDTESRHIEKDEAKIRIKSVVEKFRSMEEIKYFYKKIDSTFRGNIGKELEGFMEGLGAKYLSFVPGLPQNKRTIKEGILYVDGKEITQTSFFNDILNPVKHSYIPKIIGEQSDIEVFISKKREGRTEVEASPKIYLYDTIKEEDFFEIKEMLEKNKEDKFLAGSAGFANVIAKELGTKEKELKFKVDSSKILFACGSVNRVSLEQCKYAEENGYTIQTLNFKKVTKVDYYRDNLQEKEEINSQFLENDKFILKSSQELDVIECAKEYSLKNGIQMESIAENVADNMGELIGFLVEKNNLKNLVIFGGDTLIGVLKKLKINKLYPLAEIFPGVVLSKIYFKEKEINLVTKAGGFGEKDIVERIEQFFSEINFI